MAPPRRPSTTSQRSPSRLRTTAVTALFGLMVAASACSGGSTSDGSASAASAANAVADAFSLSADARSCLEEGFAADATARDAVTTTKELDDAQQTALAEVIERCMDNDQFAGAVSARITAALPPAEGSAVGAQVDCLSTQLLALDDVHRRALMVGLVVVATAPPTGDVALARNEALNGIYEACAVTVGQS